MCYVLLVTLYKHLYTDKKATFFIWAHEGLQIINYSCDTTPYGNKHFGAKSDKNKLVLAVLHVAENLPGKKRSQ